MTNTSSQAEYLVYGKALTTNYASSGLSFGNTEVCTIETYNQTFNLVDGWNSNEDPAAPRAVYDRSSWEVLVTLAVFMPVANARRTTSMNYAVSIMACLGIQQFNEGSRVPAPAPQPTPVDLNDGGLGGGAIAGIVVGSVVGVGLVVASVVFFWLRKRKTRRKLKARPVEVVYPEDKPPYAEVDPLAPAEFGDENTLQEIDTGEPYRSELPDAAIRDPVELAGSTSYVPNQAK